MDRERYFEYLCRTLIKESWQWRYKRLLRFLFDTEYEWDQDIYSDSARAMDGISLRRLYFNGDDGFSDPCSVLEMMAALSIRIERDIMGEPGDDHFERWFWEMLDNLDLKEETDSNFNEAHVTSVINRFMQRGYNFNGRGGLFPLTNPMEDQRSISIWNQMADYLNERYDI